ncbi:MAG: hypothetical protein LBT23_07655 [Synergistaceae bacterium]|jgi:hypothetical protein|nr:hypothetical protein [Synergistaceae bacterium]
MIKRYLPACLLALCLSVAALAAETPWMSVAERRDFPISDQDSVLSRAYEELKDVYGGELDIESLKKNKHYIHAVRSEKYKTDVIVVMIEDRSVREPDCYYEVIFELPGMNQVAVGGAWLNVPIDEYLGSVLSDLYEEGRS